MANQQRTRLIEQMLDYYDLDTEVIFLPSIPRLLNNINRSKRIRNTEGSITYAEYLFDNDVIYLNESAVNSNRQFILTVLHEIDHAIEADERSAEQFEQEYFNETATTGYYNNIYEIQAERFAEQNYNFWSEKLKRL